VSRGSIFRGGSSIQIVLYSQPPLEVLKIRNFQGPRAKRKRKVGRGGMGWDGRPTKKQRDGWMDGVKVKLPRRVGFGANY
jgi:hypothetical protein